MPARQPDWSPALLYEPTRYSYLVHIDLDRACLILFRPRMRLVVDRGQLRGGELRVALRG